MIAAIMEKQNSQWAKAHPVGLPMHPQAEKGIVLMQDLTVRPLEKMAVRMNTDRRVRVILNHQNG